MSERALKQGSILVPAAKDCLRLYSMRFCPYAQRTRLVLKSKQIPCEIINVNLKDKPSWLLAMNPAGKVPIIEFKGHVIYESAICDEMLDDIFPQPKRLLPICPFERAKHRLIMQAFDKDIVSMYGLMSRDEEKRIKSAVTLQSMLLQLESNLQRSKTIYISGQEVGMIDFHVWPWFERFPAMTQLSGRSILPADRFPRLTNWVTVMDKLKAVEETRLPTDWHAEFFLSLSARDPQYDIGLPAVSNM